jgi:hypothetical protein
LSVDIEIDLVNAGLPFGAWLCMPRAHTQLNLAEFPHRQATPDALAFWDQRLGTVATACKLIAQDMPSA